MQVIIISGSTATGKTTLGTYLAKQLNYTLYSKDDIKQRLLLADTNRRTTLTRLKSWQQTENETLKQLYEAITNCVRQQKSFIIEANFHQTDIAKLRALLSHVPVKELHCRSSGRRVITRFIRRNEAGERHPGHLDRFWYLSTILVNVIPAIAHHWNPVIIADKELVYVVDTNNFQKIDYQAILDFVYK